MTPSRRQLLRRAIFITLAVSLMAVGVAALFPSVGEIAIAAAFVVAIGYAAFSPDWREEPASGAEPPSRPPPEKTQAPQRPPERSTIPRRTPDLGDLPLGTRRERTRIL